MPPNLLRDQVTIFSQTKNLRTVREFVKRMVGQSALDVRLQGQVILAIDEAVANIIEHGYDSRDNGVIDVIIEADDNRFQVVIRDSGVSYDPNEKENPDMDAHVAQGKKRGLGIFLMRKIMDEVRYVFKEGVRNELILVKYIPHSPDTPGVGPPPLGPGEKP